MNQRLDRIDWCHPIIRQPVLSLVERCGRQLGRKLLIVHGYRSVDEQMLLYQKGRVYDRGNGVWLVTEPKAIVTKALPGSSAHNVVTIAGVPASMAVDVIPLTAEGNPDWQVSNNFWAELYDIAWEIGLDPLGDPIGSYLAGDLGHFEEPAWRLKLESLGCHLPTQFTIPAQV